ncbi:MAG: hypothetical protein DRJ38_03445 [Thermoprotei archaeon]|nr:MAG: hypothetical protein DRJ38_03445 [Thermoprotei archaeon]
MFRFFFGKHDLERLYDRQMRIKGLDQDKIREAKIGIIGVGETGSHAAIYSARVGIGCIRLCDFDDVEIHNVPRMLGVTTRDVGKNKAEALAKAVGRLGNGSRAEAYREEAKHLPERFFQELDELIIICKDLEVLNELESRIGEVAYRSVKSKIRVYTARQYLQELRSNLISRKGGKKSNYSIEPVSFSFQDKKTWKKGE